MPYRRVNWRPKPSVSTPITPENLNIMDKGIADAHSQLQQIETQTATKTELNIVNGRVETILALPEDATINDARLEDIKVGADGKTYDSPGEAVRGQVGDVINTLENFTYKHLSKNRFNKNKVTLSKYIASDGFIKDNTVTFISEPIPIEPNRDLALTGIIYLSWLDINKVFISNSASDQVTVKAPANAYYVIINATINALNLDVVQLEYGTVRTPKEEYSEKIYVKSTNVERKYPVYDIVVSLDEDGDFASVTDAVNNALEGQTIFVKKGVYENETIKAWTKVINIVGEGRDVCKIINTTADYATPPLEISGGYVSGLTFCAKNDGVTIPASTLPYAVHIENNYSSGKTLVFENCALISEFNSAVGMGLRSNFKVTFRNCDLINNKVDDTKGALFFHDGNDSAYFGNQYCEFENCNFIAPNASYAMTPYSLGHTANNLEMTFRRCMLLCKNNEKGDASIRKWVTTPGSKWNGYNNFTLSSMSWGNSAPLLNT